MVKTQSISDFDFVIIPDNKGVTYEEIRAISWRNRTSEPMGDNDIA